MNSALAATFILGGAILITWAVMMWIKRYRQNKEHSAWVTLLMALGGAALGIGIGAVAGIDVAQQKIGYCPLWIPFVAVVGFGFFLEVRGWGDHHARTPVLGLLTAMVLFIAIGNSVVKVTTHEINRVATTSVVQRAPQGKG
jgi:hypothetical protein